MVLVLSKVILVFNSFRVEKVLANHVKVAINFNIFFIEFVKKKLHVFLIIYKILYIDAEGENVARKRHRLDYVIQEEGCTPTMTYPSEIYDIPWEKNM